MDWTPVNSSSLDAVSYDATSNTMYVQFKNGGSYSYDDVPQDVYDGLIRAGSVGKYYTDKIKGAYAGQRM